jgi:hypothetical protein
MLLMQIHDLMGGIPTNEFVELTIKVPFCIKDAGQQLLQKRRHLFTNLQEGLCLYFVGIRPRGLLLERTCTSTTTP